MKTNNYSAPEIEILDVQPEQAVFAGSSTDVDGVTLYDFYEEEF